MRQAVEALLVRRSDFRVTGIGEGSATQSVVRNCQDLSVACSLPLSRSRFVLTWGESFLTDLECSHRFLSVIKL